MGRDLVLPSSGDGERGESEWVLDSKGTKHRYRSIQMCTFFTWERESWYSETLLHRPFSPFSSLCFSSSVCCWWDGRQAARCCRTNEPTQAACLCLGQLSVTLLYPHPSIHPSIPPPAINPGFWCHLGGQVKSFSCPLCCQWPAIFCSVGFNITLLVVLCSPVRPVTSTYCSQFHWFEIYSRCW